nr:MCP four helix bundle domain-containing protein [Syntrophorhabdaceae bacterium]
MRFFENIRIGKRLSIGFSILIAIIVLMGLLGFKIIYDVDRKAGQIVETAFEKTILANTVMGAIHNANNSMGIIAFTTDAAVVQTEKETLSRMRQTYGEALKKLEALEQDQRGKELIARYKAVNGSARDSNNRLIEHVVNKEHAKAIEVYLNETKPAARTLITTLQSLVGYQEGNVRNQFGAIRESNQRYTIILIVFGIAAILLGVILSISIT